MSGTITRDEAFDQRPGRQPGPGQEGPEPLGHRPLKSPRRPPPHRAAPCPPRADKPSTWPYRSRLALAARSTSTIGEDLPGGHDCVSSSCSEGSRVVAGASGLVPTFQMACWMGGALRVPTPDVEDLSQPDGVSAASRGPLDSQPSKLDDHHGRVPRVPVAELDSLVSPALEARFSILSAITELAPLGTGRNLGEELAVKRQVQGVGLSGHCLLSSSGRWQ